MDTPCVFVLPFLRQNSSSLVLCKHVHNLNLLLSKVECHLKVLLISVNRSLATGSYRLWRERPVCNVFYKADFPGKHFH